MGQDYLGMRYRGREVHEAEKFRVGGEPGGQHVLWCAEAPQIAICPDFVLDLTGLQL